MRPRIKFCGAAGTVTGSCFWIKSDAASFLVDCGMYQGSKTLKELNYGDFPFSPADIDFVLLTHAHIDHSGLVPKLVKHGFTGPIFTTEGTRDLLAFMWPDSAYIQETEVKFLNRRREQKGIKTVTPIYDQSDAHDAINQIKTIDYASWTDPMAGVRMRYWNAGHILGSASIEVEIADSAGETIRLLFSGDIGPEHKLFHPNPDAPDSIDFLVCEATYGDRLKTPLSPEMRRDRLAAAINEAIRSGEGVLVVPAFSVERTQELLIDIGILLREKRIHDSLVFLDSPLAIKATQTFALYADDLEDVSHSDTFLFNDNFVFTKDADESKRINAYKNNIIIIAASGMCEAGRIRHHLKRRLWNPNATVMMVGYQAPGTLGALLLNGKKAVRIQGETVKVRATITDLDVYSGHADADGLEEWVLDRMPVRGNVFLVHGEPSSLDSLRSRLVTAGLSDERVVIPELDNEYELSPQRAEKTKGDTKPRIATATASRLDWHNDLAQLSLDIVDELEGAADERSRQIILRRLRRALEKDERPD
ncbi:MAG: MBL fold metallo-hydrolase [Marinicaulis sp.]|nr:MBL fold metallo-hydrolase [Marinicaulis sp.]